MGLDIHIYRARRNPKEFTKEQWDEYYRGEDNEEETPIMTEVFYARKFWKLHYAAIEREVDEYDGSEYIRLEREDIERMIKCAVVTRNYFGDFSCVPPLCEILDNFDVDEEHGWHYFYYASW